MKKLHTIIPAGIQCPDVESIQIKITPTCPEALHLGIIDNTSDTELWFNVDHADVLVDMLAKAVEIVKKYHEDLVSEN